MIIQFQKVTGRSVKLMVGKYSGPPLFHIITGILFIIDFGFPKRIYIGRANCSWSGIAITEAGDGDS